MCKEERIVVTFNTTNNLSVLRQQWDEARRLSPDTAGTNIVFEGDLGGKFTIIDPNTGNLISELNIEQPNGFYLDRSRREIIIVSMGDNSLIVWKPPFEGKVITHNLFNDLHSVVKTKLGYLVTSTGLDMILEVNREGDLLWMYDLTMTHPDLPEGGRRLPVDRNIDHRTRRYPTLQQTTHVNSAIFMDDGERYVLATLFHQGTLIKIDKQTGEEVTVLSGLHCPHSIRRTKDGFMLVSSRDNRVVFLSRALRVSQDLHIPSASWIQDAVLVGNNIIVADSNNNRLLVLDTQGNVLNEMPYNPQWRIFQLEAIGKEYCE